MKNFKSFIAKLFGGKEEITYVIEPTILSDEEEAIRLAEEFCEAINNKDDEYLKERFLKAGLKDYQVVTWIETSGKIASNFIRSQASIIDISILTEMLNFEDEAFIVNALYLHYKDKRIDIDFIERAIALSKKEVYVEALRRGRYADTQEVILLNIRHNYNKYFYLLKYLAKYSKV